MTSRSRAIVLTLALAALSIGAFVALRDDASHGPQRRDDEPVAAVDAPSVVARDAVTDEREAVVEVRDARPSAFTFEQLVRPVERGIRAPLAEFDVVGVSIAGEPRRAQSGDLVLEDELAAGALWIVSAEGFLPRALDAALCAERAAAGESAPLELERIPATTLVLHVGAPLADSEPIERLRVIPSVGESAQLEAVASAPPLGADAATIAADALRAGLVTTEVLRRAADEGVLASDALAFLRTLDLSATPDADHAWTGVWALREVPRPSGTTLTFPDVPADVHVGLAARGGRNFALLRADGSNVPTVARSGVCFSAPMRVAPGSVLELTLEHRSPCVVRGRLPHDVLPGAVLSLSQSSHSDRGFMRGGRSYEHGAPSIATDGSFEWSTLTAGRFHFHAEWYTAGNVWAQRSFARDLAPGDVWDIGLLQPPEGARLTVVARLAPVDVGAFASAGLDATQFTIDAALALHPPNASDAAQVRDFPFVDVQSFSLVHDMPLTLTGIESGMHHVQILGLRDRDEDASVDPSSGSAPSALPITTSPSERLMLVAPVVEVVALATEAHVEIDVPVVTPTRCTIAVPVPVHLAVPNLVVKARLVRTDRETAIDAPPFAWTSVAHGGGLATTDLHVAPGAWTALVTLELPATVTDRERFHVGRIDFDVVPGIDASVTVALEAAASVLLPEGAGAAPVRLAEFGAIAIPSRGRVESARRIAIGLLPHTEYVFEGRRVMTGAPGSIVEVD